MSTVSLESAPLESTAVHFLTSTAFVARSQSATSRVASQTIKSPRTTRNASRSEGFSSSMSLFFCSIPGRELDRMDPFFLLLDFNTVLSYFSNPLASITDTLVYPMPGSRLSPSFLHSSTSHFLAVQSLCLCTFYLYFFYLTAPTPLKDCKAPTATTGRRLLVKLFLFLSDLFNPAQPTHLGMCIKSSI